jgi:branched-chain amino acid transport system substrate-binding protein
MSRLFKLALGIALAGAMALPASAAEEGVTDTEILLGSHTDLSGIAAIWGVGATEGARMRYDEINEKGGIHGRKIKLVVEDHQYTVPRAISAANKLLNNDKIFAMVGALGTPMNNAVFEAQLPKGVPNIFPFTAARSMSEPFHKLKFAQLSTYYDQVRASVKYFTEKEGKKKICSYYLNGEFGFEVRDAVNDQLKAQNMTLAGEATILPTDTEFVAPVTKLKEAGCDLVVMGTIIRETIVTIGTAKKLGWNDVVFVGQNASYDPIIAAAQGGITEGFYSGAGMPYTYVDTASDEIKAWAAKYKARTGKDPNSPAEYSYVGADIIAKALEAAGKDLTREKFIAAMEGIKDYKPFLPGPVVTLGPNKHKGSSVTYLSKVQGGRWVIVNDNLLY